MQRELVERRGWLTQQRFVDLIGLSSLLPGPSSTEVALGIGFERARWRGLLIAGLGFILPGRPHRARPGVLYVEVGSLGDGRYLLYGMAPVVIAVIVHALLKLVADGASPTCATWLVGARRRSGSRSSSPAAHRARRRCARPAGCPPPAGWLARRWRRRRCSPCPWTVHALAAIGPALPSAVAAAAAAERPSIGLAAIFLTFLKIGLVVFGSGYVLIAFLGAELVEPGYITQQQLLDAIAIGQLTPGPVFTTATFIGYLMAGVPGAVVATVGIFLPAFVLVGIAHPWLDRMRANATLSAAIEGLNAAAIGLIGDSVVLLAREALWPEGELDVLAALLAARRLRAARWQAGWALCPSCWPAPLIGLLVQLARAA